MSIHFFSLSFLFLQRKRDLLLQKKSLFTQVNHCDSYNRIAIFGHWFAQQYGFK